MKIMLDTNILISALIFGGKARKILLEMLEKEYEIYISDYVSNEFSEKVHLKWPQKADSVLEAFYNLPVHFCKSSKNIQGTLRDVKDIPVLSDALFHNVDVILTGDKDFLEADLEKPVVFSIALLEEYMQKNCRIPSLGIENILTML